MAKPAEQTPLTTLEFARLVHEEIPDLPPGVFNVVTGDGPVAGREFLEVKQVHINLSEAPIGWY